MKFVALIALFATTSLAKNSYLKCNTRNLRAKYYKDDNCKTLNAAWTKEYGHVKKETKDMFSGDCETNLDNKHQSVKITCSDTEYTAKLWSDSDQCWSTPTKTFKATFGKCTKAPEGSIIMEHS